MKKIRLTLVLASLMLIAQPQAHAGIIEDLLAIPAIQSLLGRVPELAPLVKQCEDVNFKQRNQTLCQQAVQAAQLAKMPPELRAVMATPPAAASLRELCITAVGRPAYSGYLCTELYKYDQAFKAQYDAVFKPAVNQKELDDFQNRQMR